MLVCLDAGHGRETGGKRSFDESFFEWEFNRDIVSRIAKYLVAHGVQVIYTAPTDTDTSLQARCDIANKNVCDIFVSIHANAYGNWWNDAHGWEIYHVPNGVGSGKLCQAVNAYTKDLGLTNRGIKEANFYVLKYTNAPAILIEHFFYTNQAELAKCNTDEMRELFAVCDARGILDYLGIAWKGETGATPTTTVQSQVTPAQTNIQILKTKLNLTDQTIQYLLAYQYGNELIERIVTNLK